MNDSQLMNKKSSCIFEILTQQHIGLLIKHITLCKIYISTYSRAFFLITWTTISRKEGSSLCSRFTALPSQRLARKSTLFLFHFYVFCRRCCPCTMVHVISGEWSSPDAYTNSFSAFSPLPPPSPLLHPRRIPFNIFLSFLRFSSDSVGGGHNETSGIRHCSTRP